MLLLTGPPGSGKTQQILDRLNDGLRRGGSPVRLLTPTATMAEHLRNELARKLGGLPDGVILTLHHFLRDFPTAHEPISQTMLRHLVRRALEETTPEAFQGVAGYWGFRAAVGDLLNELSDAGIRSFDLDRRLGPSLGDLLHRDALIGLLARIEDELLRRRKLTRADHVRAVALRISEDGPGQLDHVLFDGFFTFSPAERDLIRALSEHVEVTVTLPRWNGSDASRESLLRMGFDEHVLPETHRKPDYSIVRAQNSDAEAVEIARRILDEVRRGRRFRDIGVIVRKARPYGPVLENALARFGIPARLYFGQPLTASPAIGRVVQVMESWQKGWDLEPLLAAVRLDTATPARDTLDFGLREQIPAEGLSHFASLDRVRRYARLLPELEALDRDRDRPAPAREWATRLLRLARLFPEPIVADRVAHARAAAWRLDNSAIEQLAKLLDEVVELFDPNVPVPLGNFWEECRLAIDDARLFLRDRRHDVVHVIDAVEARQWELPVVFVCGLVEDEFPRRPVESALLPDSVRHDLRRQGVPLKTTAQAAQEEDFLFELALSRATGKTTLTYPAYDAAGNPTLSSFLLGELRDSLDREPEADEHPVPVRPASLRLRVPAARPHIWAEDLLAELKRRHKRFSPSGIELFIACPFRFFIEKTLRLDEPPPDPFDRLDAQLEGRIVHEVLSRLDGRSGSVQELFERIFEEFCGEANIPSGYRRERVRLEMLRSLERWVEEDPLPTSDEVRREESFEIELAPDFRVAGRIDRMNINAARRVLVVDYKYSAAARLREYRKGAEEGQRVQAGLYLIAAREAFDLTPAGMLYASLRREPACDGWCIGELAKGFKKSIRCTPEDLERLMTTAQERTVDTVAQIRAGEIAPGADDDKACAYCTAADLCRRRELEQVVRAGGDGA